MTAPDCLAVPAGQGNEALRLRVLGPADIDHIGALFARLTPRSRRMRYLAPVHRLSAASLRHLADIDHDRHEAVGIFSAGALVGAAHYFRRDGAAGPASAADICVEIADSHQRRGLGTRLLEELAQVARCRGITEFTATALAENTAVRAMVQRSGLPADIRLAHAELTIRVSLAPAG